MKKITRRLFLNQSTKFLAFIPFVNIISCIPDHDTVLSPEDSLKKLIFNIGPWAPEDIQIAEDFARRFLKTDFISQYLPKSDKIIQSLSNRLPGEDQAVNNIDLNNIPKDEQEILKKLAKQLYSFVEVRFYVSNAPPWGQCIGNSKWHTRIPTQI
ncbi:MAG: hypothetical protein ABFS12_17615 [Bacteroidota bacterium]